MIRDLRLGSAILMMAATTASMAQVPNGGFENWTDFGDYEDPTGWSSFNVLTSAFGGTQSCEQVPGAVGSYAVKVNTVDVPGVGLLPGLLLSGDADAGSEGFPFTQRPPALNGKWKAAVQPGDAGNVTVYLSRWDPIAQERVNVGFGSVTISGTVNNWTNFSASIIYQDPQNPDTASIVILSSFGSAVAGSNITVDDLSFGAAVGIAEAYSGQVQVYPVPAMDMLNVTTEIPMQHLSLLAVDGRMVRQLQPISDRITLDLQDLPAGVYTVVAHMSDATVLRRSVVKQ